MKRFRKLLANHGLQIAALLLLIVIAFGCSKKNAQNKKIKIGVVAPLTGPAAPYGENVRDGILLAVEEINKAKGISGHKINLIIEDEGGGPRAAVDAVKKLITMDGVPVIIGPTTSNGLMAAAPIAEKNHVILFSSGAASDNVREAGDYIFRNRASAYQEAVALAQYALTDIGLKRFAILRSDADYAVSFADAFRQIVRKSGGVVVQEEPFQEGSTDFRTQLSKIAGAEPRPEGLFLIGVPIELGNILKQIREMGLKQTMFSNSIESPEIFKIAGDATEGLIFSTTFYDPERGDEKLEKFDRRFREKYGRASDLFAANGYDAVHIIKLAIEKGGYNGEHIKTALYNLKGFRGLVGPIEFDDKGDIRAVIAIKEIVKGKFKFVKLIQ